MVRDQYIREGEGFVCVYSITSKKSFDQVRRIFKKIPSVAEYRSLTSLGIEDPRTRATCERCETSALCIVWN